MKTRSGLLPSLGLAALALIYRAILRGRYYGAEEEDYGNLGLIRGTLDSGFTYIETQHMPLFTSLAAAVTGLVGDAELGGELVAMTSGAATVGLASWLGWRWFRPHVGLLAGLLLCFSPLAALHSATPLRISLFGFLTLLGVYLAGERAPIRAGLVLSLAFLTRFDTAFTLLPALGLLSLSTVLSSRSRNPPKWHIAAPLLLGISVIAWALYYQSAEGTLRFWGDVATRTSGASPSALQPLKLLGFIEPVLLYTGLLPLLPLPLAIYRILRAAPGDSTRQRWFLLCGSSVFGFLLLSVLLSTYRPDHNLFLKWMVTSLPFLFILGVQGWFGLMARHSRLTPWALLVTSIVVGVSYAQTTSALMQRSEQWYGTQVEFTRWFDASYPQDIGLVADNIPATWLSRKPSSRLVVRWSWDPSPNPEPDEGPGGVPAGLSAEAFGEWLLANRLGVVITFDEDNEGSLTKAPWLSELGIVDLGPARLEPIAREAGYGFTAWLVQGSGLPGRLDQGPPLRAGAVRILVR